MLNNDFWNPDLERFVDRFFEHELRVVVISNIGDLAVVNAHVADLVLDVSSCSRAARPQQFPSSCRVQSDPPRRHPLASRPPLLLIRQLSSPLATTIASRSHRQVVHPHTDVHSPPRFDSILDPHLCAPLGFHSNINNLIVHSSPASSLTLPLASHSALPELATSRLPTGTSTPLNPNCVNSAGHIRQVENSL